MATVRATVVLVRMFVVMLVLLVVVMVMVVVVRTDQGLVEQFFIMLVRVIAENLTAGAFQVAHQCERSAGLGVTADVQ